MIRGGPPQAPPIEIPESAVAYVDADWLHPAAGMGVSALVIDRETVTWDGTERDRPSDSDPDRLAAEILCTAAMVASKGLDGAARNAAICGVGAMAVETSRLIGCRCSPDPPRGSADLTGAIDFTGDPERIQRLAGAILPLGRIVLAGERHGDALPFNLYPDVHVRGLTLVALDPIGRVLDSRQPSVSPAIAPPVDLADAADLGGGWFRFQGEQEKT